MKNNDNRLYSDLHLFTFFTSIWRTSRFGAEWSNTTFHISMIDHVVGCDQQLEFRSERRTTVFRCVYRLMSCNECRHVSNEYLYESALIIKMFWCVLCMIPARNTYHIYIYICVWCECVCMCAWVHYFIFFILSLCVCVCVCVRHFHESMRGESVKRRRQWVFVFVNDCVLMHVNVNNVFL